MSSWKQCLSIMCGIQRSQSDTRCKLSCNYAKRVRILFMPPKVSIMLNCVRYS